MPRKIFYPNEEFFPNSECSIIYSVKRLANIVNNLKNKMPVEKFSTPPPAIHSKNFRLE